MTKTGEMTVWTVTQLNRRVGELLQGHFSRIWVRGEISNFTQAASGHWYFSIKDEGATVRAVMFRGRAQLAGLVPKPGERFEFRVTVTLYEPRGDYQVQVDSLRRAGRSMVGAAAVTRPTIHEVHASWGACVRASSVYWMGWR